MSKISPAAYCSPSPGSPVVDLSNHCIIFNYRVVSVPGRINGFSAGMPVRKMCSPIWNRMHIQVWTDALILLIMLAVLSRKLGSVYRLSPQLILQRVTFLLLLECVSFVLSLRMGKRSDYWQRRRQSWTCFLMALPLAVRTSVNVAGRLWQHLSTSIATPDSPHYCATSTQYRALKEKCIVPSLSPES